MTVLSLAAAAVGGIVVGILGSLVAAEVLGYAPRLVEWIVERSSLWQPYEDRLDYIDENLDHHYCYQQDGQALTSLKHAVGEWFYVFRANAGSADARQRRRQGHLVQEQPSPLASEATPEAPISDTEAKKLDLFERLEQSINESGAWTDEVSPGARGPLDISSFSVPKGRPLDVSAFAVPRDEPGPDAAEVGAP